MAQDRDKADRIPNTEAFRELVVSARVYYKNDRRIDWAEWQHLTNEAAEHGLGDEDALRAAREALGNGSWSPPLAPPSSSSSGSARSLRSVMGPDSLEAVSIETADQASTTTSRLKPGVVINDTYRLDKEIGSGGMGVVWRASHTKLGTVAAIKFLKRAVDEESAARFLREARATARLEGPHLARVFDCAQLETGELFIVMEYFEGMGLDGVLRRDGKLPVVRAVDYILQACAGLAAAHRREIVHRDIKPANLFLARTEDGGEQIKLVDFGLSRLAQPDQGEGLTRQEILLGTPEYAPPEQFGNAMNAREPADIWALGATLYCLLTGGPPFRKKPELDGLHQISDLLERVMKAPPCPVTTVREDVPADLEKVIFKCLEKKPEDRYPNVGDLALDLARFGSAGADAQAAEVVGILASASPATSSPDSRRSPSLNVRVTVLSPSEAARKTPARSSDRTLWIVAVVVIAAIAGLVFALRS